MTNQTYFTYFVSNNKTRIASIWQTELPRAEAIQKLNFQEYDAFITCDDVIHAQELMEKGNYKFTNITDFY